MSYIIYYLHLCNFNLRQQANRIMLLLCNTLCVFTLSGVQYAAAATQNLRKLHFPDVVVRYIMHIIPTQISDPHSDRIMKPDIDAIDNTSVQLKK